MGDRFGPEFENVVIGGEAGETRLGS